MRQLTHEEQRRMRELAQVLLREVPPERFCLDGSKQEGRMCLECGDGAWYVFFCELGLGEDVSVHPTLEEAALQLIVNVAPSEVAQERMRRAFIRQM